MAGTLVDSSVLLDVSTEDPVWFDWSAAALANAVRSGPVVVNPIIYAEVSVGFDRIEDLDDALPADIFRREPLPYASGFLAGKAYRDLSAAQGHALVAAAGFLHRGPCRGQRACPVDAGRGSLPRVLPDSGPHHAVGAATHVFRPFDVCKSAVRRTTRAPRWPATLITMAIGGSLGPILEGRLA